MPANTPTIGTGSEDIDEIDDGQRAREREPRPVRDRPGEEDVVEDREQRAGRRRLQRSGREERRQHGQRQPAQQHHPARQRVLRHRQLPHPQQHRAQRPGDRGAEDQQRRQRRALQVPDVVAEQQRHAHHAERHAGDLARRQRLAQQRHREQHAPDRHRVGDDRAAAGGQLLQAEQHQAVPAGDVEERERRELAPQRARHADRVAGELRHREQAERRERQRQRAERQRRDLRDAHLQHRPVAAPDERQHGDGQQRRRRDVRLRRGRGAAQDPPERRCAPLPQGAAFALGAARRAHPRSRGGTAAPYLLWYSARACVTQASRRMRPGNSCRRESTSSMSRSVQLAIWRYVVMPSW